MITLKNSNKRGYKKIRNILIRLMAIIAAMTMLMGSSPVKAEITSETSVNAEGKADAEKDAVKDEKKSDDEVQDTGENKDEIKDENVSADGAEDIQNSDDKIESESQSDDNDVLSSPEENTAKAPALKATGSDNVQPIDESNTAKIPVKINVFDYGSNINSKYVSDKGYLQFYDSKAAHNVDQLINGVGDPDGDPPELKSTLVNGYPETTSGKNLKYLFDSSMQKSTTSHVAGKTDYTVERYEIASPNSGFFIRDDEGYYTYDSAQYAAALSDTFENGNTKFELYNYHERPYDAAPGHGTASYANFLPFNKAHEGYESIGYVDSNGNEITDKTCYSLPSKTTDIAHAADMWFGFTAEFEFTQPLNGKVKIPDTNEWQDMIFDFRGDDDVWVFIDDVLVMDLGGSHAPQTGQINFNTGEVIQRNEDEEDINTSPTSLSTRFKAAGRESSITENGRFQDYSKHTLKFFYMERGGDISSMRLRFNFTPDLGTINVSKEIKDYDDINNDNAVPLHGIDDEFTYILYTKGPEEQNFTPYSGSYEVYENNLLEDTRNTQGNVFTIKADQKAVFPKMDGETQYKVVETGLNDARYPAVKIDGVDNAAAEDNGVSGHWSPIKTIKDSTAVMYTNYIDKKPIIITKNVTLSGNSDAGSSEIKFPIKITVKGSPYTGCIYDSEGNEITDRKPNDNGVTFIKNGETLKTERIPVGDSYSVEEVTSADSSDWHWYYDTTVNKKSGYRADGNISKENENRIDFINDVKLVYLEILKTDMDKTPLKDAEFALYGSSECTGEPIAVIKADEEGKYKADNLDSRKTYYLIETKAPEGYDLLGKAVPVKFVPDDEGNLIVQAEKEGLGSMISDDDNKITVKNKESYVLPKTGGSGTRALAIGGGALIVCALLLEIFKGRKYGVKAGK